MASPNYSAFLNVKPVEAPDVPDFTKSTDELMKTGMQMARIANAGSGGGRSRANKDVSLRVVPDPSSPNGYRLEYSYGRTPKERIANDAIMDGIRAKQLVANDEVVQGIMQKLDSPDVSYQSKFELMNDLRQNQLSRLQRSSGLSKDMLIDALDLRSRQQGLNAQRKTIEDTSAFKTLYDTGKMMFSRVKDTFAPGQSAEEELAAGKERLAEQQKILENNAYLREQELMAREGRSAYEKAHTSETGSSLLNIGSTIVDSAGDIGVTVGAAALGGASGGAAGTAAAPGPGTVVGSIAGSITGAAGANAAITRQQFIDAIVANPDLTDEQKLDAIRNYSGKAAATGAAVGAAVDIGTLGLGKIAGKVLNRGTANRMVQEAIGKDAAASAAANAVGKAGARNISRITAEAAGVGTSSAASRNAAYRGLGSYLTRDLPREAATAAAYGGANLMGLNYLLNEATGENRPITEGLDEALLSGAAFGAVFGLGRNLRRPRNPEGGRRRRVDDQLGELKAPPKEGGDGSTGGDNLLRVDNKKGAPNAEAQYGKYAEPFRKLLHEYEGRETDPNMLRTKMEYYYEQWGKAGLSRDQFDQFLLDNSKASEANRMTPELVSLLKDIHDKAAPVKAAAKGKQPVAENPNELPSTKVDRLNEVKNIAMPDRLSGGRTTSYMDSIAEVIDRFYEEGGSWADINQYLDEHTSSKNRKHISKSKRGFMPERQMNAIAKAAEIRWKEFQTKKQQAQLLEAMNKNANGKPVARIDDATAQQIEALLNGETPATPATPAPPAGGNAGVGGANGGAEGRPVVNDTASASGGTQPDAGTAPAAPVVPAGQASRGGADTASARNGEQPLPSQRPNQAPEAAANEPGSGGSTGANGGAGAPAVTGAEAAGAGARGAAGERSGGTGDSSVQAAAGGTEQPSRTVETETARIQKQLEDLGVPFGVARNSATLFRANALNFERAYGRSAADTLSRIQFLDGGVLTHTPKGWTFFQLGYNASRRPFERYSTEYIGSGEGSQVWGWGWYIALTKETGEDYRDLFRRGRQYSVNALRELRSKDLVLKEESSGESIPLSRLSEYYGASRAAENIINIIQQGAEKRYTPARFKAALEPELASIKNDIAETERQLAGNKEARANIQQELDILLEYEATPAEQRRTKYSEDAVKAELKRLAAQSRNGEIPAAAVELLSRKQLLFDYYNEYPERLSSAIDGRKDSIYDLDNGLMVNTSYDLDYLKFIQEVAKSVSGDSKSYSISHSTDNTKPVYTFRRKSGDTHVLLSAEAFETAPRSVDDLFLSQDAGKPLGYNKLGYFLEQDVHRATPDRAAAEALHKELQQDLRYAQIALDMQAKETRFGLAGTGYKGMGNREKLAAAKKDVRTLEQRIQFLDEYMRGEIEVKNTSPSGLPEPQLYSVDIPDDNVMMFTKLPFKEQTPEIQQKLQKVMDDLGLPADAQERIKNAELTGHWQNGKDGTLYGRIVHEYSTHMGHLPNEKGRYPEFKEDSKTVSLTMHENGIEGLRYIGGNDGECAVVFTGEAIQIVEAFEQAMKATGTTNAKDLAKAMESRGRTVFMKDGTTKIFLNKNADVSTIVHEGGHSILENMISIARETRHPGIEADLRTLMKYAKLSDTANMYKLKAAERRQLHEAVARGFEEYMSKGKAPTAELKSVFQRFKEWLGRIYKDIKAYVAGEEGIELNKDVEAVFDRWFTTPEERAAVETPAPKPTAPKGKPRPAPKARQLSLFDSPPVEIPPTDVVNTLSQDAIADRLRADIEGAPHPDDANAAGILIDAGDGNFVRADDLDMGFIQPDAYIRGGNGIRPPHPVRDQKKADALTQRFNESGVYDESAPPILVVDLGNEYQALTGSHRLAAVRASEAEVDVPVTVIEWNKAFDEDLTALVEAKDDYDRLDILTDLYNRGGVSREAYMVMKQEVEQGNREFTLLQGTRPEGITAKEYSAALDNMTETKNRVFEGDDC